MPSGSGGDLGSGTSPSPSQVQAAEVLQGGWDCRKGPRIHTYIGAWMHNHSLIMRRTRDVRPVLHFCKQASQHLLLTAHLFTHSLQREALYSQTHWPLTSEPPSLTILFLLHLHSLPLCLPTNYASLQTYASFQYFKHTPPLSSPKLLSTIPPSHALSPPFNLPRNLSKWMSTFLASPSIRSLPTSLLFLPQELD